MAVFETVLREIKNRQESGEPIDWDEARKDLRETAGRDLEKSKYHYFLSKIIEGVQEDRNAAILDYGCGGGFLIIRLYFMGYENIKGVDVGGQRLNRELAESAGMGDVFTTYDGTRLPYADDSFDLIISETVLEHVKDIEAYYSEAARVLKPGGALVAYFPHRLAPFDTHSRTWFIHYLPAKLRRPLYSRFAAQPPEYYEDILHFRTRGTHIRTALKHFSRYEDHAVKRIRSYRYQGQYKGNARLRGLMDRCVRLPLFGGMAASLLANLADADLHFYK